jgi:multiple sugar transport system substrate-binding protein
LKATGAVAGAAALAPILAACGDTGGGSSGGSSTEALKFWDMPWGQAAYNTTAQTITEAYKPASGLPAATYQVIPWSNFAQTFSAAIASNTGPAVSSGGGFQAFQFSEQGSIAYADNLIASWQKSGFADDFLPGTIESMKTDKGYVAVPTHLDMRVWWYRKSLFDQAGLAVPTTWDELLTVAETFGKQGIYSFGVGAGAGNFLGNHAMVSMMINNGGGIFSPDGKVDLVTDRNVEAINFVLELYKAGGVDPAAVSYTSDNLQSQWKSNKLAMGMYAAGLDENIGDTTGDILAMSPLTAPHGDQGTLYFGNNAMMYTNTPSQEGSEAFLNYWMQNYQQLWQQKVIPSLPVLKSVIALPEFQANTQKVKIIEEWQPIAKNYATLAPNVTAVVAQIDGGQAQGEFTQTILSGQADAKAALEKFQSDISAFVK